MDIRIRNLRPEDMEESMKLSQFAFQYQLGPEELQERIARSDPGNTWGAFLEDGALAAKLTVLPLGTYIGGRAVPMGGIAGVATWPEHRREGLVKKLLQQALMLMREKGQWISLLHPFQFEFYRRFGWETYTEYKKYELETAQLPRFADTGGWVQRLPEVRVLQALYTEYARRFNGMLERTPAWWEWNIMKLKNGGGHSAVYYAADGTPKGYLLYKVKDQILTVNEWVSLDSDARRGLWNYISNHDSMIKKAVLQAEPGDRLTSLLKDPRIKQETVPYFMARLVDAKSFLEGYRFKEGRGGVLNLAVQDPHAPWNEGTYTLRLQNDGTATVKFASGMNPPRPDGGLSCGIGVLTAILLGYETPMFWYEAGRLEGTPEAVERLEAALPERKTYLLDFF